jgi:hypothetical protein
MEKMAERVTETIELEVDIAFQDQVEDLDLSGSFAF